MKKRFIPNLTRGGRIVRAVLATLLLIGALFAWDTTPWLAVVLGLSSAFVFFEAARGWCAVRACGIKTKI